MANNRARTATDAGYAAAHLRRFTGDGKLGEYSGWPRQMVRRHLIRSGETACPGGQELAAQETSA